MSTRFDLGGTSAGRPGWLSVNLVGCPDVRHDIIDMDGYIAEDDFADEFYLCHTLEHVPMLRYWRFLNDLKRKLKAGGIVRVAQTDAAAVMTQWQQRILSFRAMRATLFPPANRLQPNELNEHRNMWSEDELARDFEKLGFSVSRFDAGSWSYDVEDDGFPDECKVYRGTRIKNLGIIATKTQA